VERAVWPALVVVVAVDAEHMLVPPVMAPERRVEIGLAAREGLAENGILGPRLTIEGPEVL
jgi:hypothetical protein